MALFWEIGLLCVLVVEGLAHILVSNLYLSTLITMPSMGTIHYATGFIGIRSEEFFSQQHWLVTMYLDDNLACIDKA